MGREVDPSGWLGPQHKIEIDAPVLAHGSSQCAE